MAHWMNLSASQAVKVTAIRSAQTVVHEAAALFRTSSKKTAVLKQCIEDADDTRVSKRQLMNLCETRFLERHTAIVTFRQLFGFVAEALEEIKSWTSASAVQSASSLYASMHQFEFVVGLVILENLAGLLLPVSRKLQAVENDSGGDERAKRGRKRREILPPYLFSKVGAYDYRIKPGYKTVLIFASKIH